MHRLPDIRTLRRFRVSAVLLLAKWLVVPCAIGILAYGLVWHQTWRIWLGLGLVGLTVVLGIWQRLAAASCRCPLCLGRPLSGSGASRNRKAQRLLGSYRLRVASSIIFRKSFRCPYCGEPTAVALRQRRKGNSGV